MSRVAVKSCIDYLKHKFYTRHSVCHSITLYTFHPLFQLMKDTRTERHLVMSLLNHTIAHQREASASMPSNRLVFLFLDWLPPAASLRSNSTGAGSGNVLASIPFFFNLFTFLILSRKVSLCRFLSNFLRLLTKNVKKINSKLEFFKTFLHQIDFRQCYRSTSPSVSFFMF